jgi:hypothetical protein
MPEETEQETNGKDHSVSTPEQFRAIADRRKRDWEASELGEIVALPSGLKLRIRRPNPLWYVLEGRVPSSLAAKLGDYQESREMTPDGMVELSNWVVRLIEHCVVEPRVKLNPGPGEIDPNWVTDQDLEFILRYTGGETAADGRSLGRFSGEPRIPNDSASGGNVEMPTVRTAGDQRGDGPAN